MNEVIIQGMIGICATVITGAISIMIAFLQKKIKSERIDQALQRLELFSTATVSDLQQTLVNQIKSKSPDGKLNGENIAWLKEESTRRVLEMLDGPAAALLHSVGVDLQMVIASFVERTVLQLSDKRIYSSH